MIIITTKKERKKMAVSLKELELCPVADIYSRRRRRRREEQRKYTVSLLDDRSQGGNGLLHLIDVTSGELEHRRDRGLLGELEFLQGLVSGLHLNQPSHLKKTNTTTLSPSCESRRSQGEFPGLEGPR